MEENVALGLVSGFVSNTETHIFLTGKAGTGKTTFLRSLKTITHKRFIVVAPTGVAAINAGGVTIHSFFQLPFGPQLPETAKPQWPGRQEDPKTSAARFQKLNRTKIDIIRSLDLLVIDEISMVRADLLDAVDSVLRRYRSRNVPFGGVQLLMIGDLRQLAPVAKEEEWQMLRPYYDSVYFFSSRALQQCNYLSIELTHVYRQSDEKFINLLNKIRDNRLDRDAAEMLNSRYKKNFEVPEDEGYITLTTHNAQADAINLRKLNGLPGQVKKFTAKVEGDFPEYSFPTSQVLELKPGAQVMFVKNDPDPLKRFFNGKIGKLVSIDDKTLTVTCADDEEIEVEPLEWQNCKYSMDEKTKEITETIAGTFVQYPLRLAWAITIHKSQGLTFDKAVIDANMAFAHGQVYVALSRCRTFDGLVLSSPIQASAIKSDNTVGSFIGRIEEQQPDSERLLQETINFQYSLIRELFQFETLQRRIERLSRFVQENQSSIDDATLASITAIRSGFQEQIHQVSLKFLNQLERLFVLRSKVEEHHELQARISKAAAYFAPLLRTLFFDHWLNPETDNKLLAKQFGELTDRIYREAWEKLSCMNVSLKGFDVNSFLRARALATVELPEFAKKVKKTGRKPSGNEIQRKLREWRDELAAEKGLDPYRILPVKTIRLLVREMPSDFQALLAVKGIGKVTVSKFGSRILELINGKAPEASETFANDESIEEPVEVKKHQSRNLSAQLHREGMSPEQIAAERGLATSTIHGHLAQCVLRGELELDNLVTVSEKILVSEYFIETMDPSLGAARHVLGEEISFYTLRYVLNHLIKNGLMQQKE
jgi:hypothetical protein